MKASTNSRAIQGLYAITPDMADTEALCSMVQAAIAGGARIVQYRNKIADIALRQTQALALLQVCRSQGARLIINDHVQLCLSIDAEGVHVGSDDYEYDGVKSLQALRERLGDKLLGVSCYNQLKLAQQAEQRGADYIAFGACFASGTKPAAIKAELQLFAQAAQCLDVDKVAIGGINLDNAGSVVEAGADAIAVINALWSSADIEHTARQFSALFDSTDTSI